MRIKNSAIYQKLTCPTISAGIIVTVAYFAFLMVLPYLPSISQVFYNDVNSGKVEVATKEIRNYCGEKYFTVWMSLQMDRSKDKFVFKEIKGCAKGSSKDCSFDVKVFNPYYEGSHFLDTETYKFINSFSNEDVFYTKNMEGLKKYKTINNILVNTNKALTGIGVKVVKDIQNNIIYVFSITHLEGAKKCGRKIIAEKLQGLNKVAREGL